MRPIITCIAGKSICLILLLILPFLGSAQKEAAIWYFGNNAGLDFRTGTPRPLLNGMVNTIEGCESYSDGDGNLLFYTDGKTVWDRNHTVMDNGTELKSSFSTAQAALVVPHPGDPDLYYIFTPDDALAYNGLIEGGSNGFNYSILDISLDNGRGDLIEKNTDLLENASENVTAVRNFEQDAYWVLTHHMDRFYAYRIDQNGLDPQPVISQLGPAIIGEDNVRGNIKISPDGNRVAIAHNVLEPQYESHLYLYDFDANTGQVSNPRGLAPSRLYYGVEFSPDSSKLYASGMPILMGDNQDLELGKLEIVQFDLEAANVGASEYLLHKFDRSLPGWVSGSLQLAIDKKIYHSIPDEQLSVIRSPDNVGINADFRPFDTSLGGRRASYGLPPYIQSFFQTIIEIEQLCLNEPTKFTIEEAAGIASVSWDFGDPLSGVENTSNEFNPQHLFSTFGVFEVRLIVTYENGSSREFVEFVEIAQVPDLLPEVTLVQCDIDGVDDGRTLFNLREAIDLFNQGNPDISAFFFESRSDAEANINFLDPAAYLNTADGQVVYARAFENPDCPAIVEVVLRTNWIEENPDVDQVPVCLDKPPSLAVEFYSGQLYQYLEERFPAAETLVVYRSEEDALLERQEVVLETLILGPFDSNRFWYRLEQQNQCEYIAAIDVEFRTPPQIEEEREVFLCNGFAQLEATAGFETYLWEDGSSNPIRQITGAGTYSVIISQGGCDRLQTFQVSVPQTFSLDAIRKRDFQDRNSLEIVASNLSTPLRYSVDGGKSFQESPRFENLLPGVYEVVVRDDCKIVEETVVVGGLPKFFTPNGDGQNDHWRMTKLVEIEGYVIQVFDRYGNLVIVLDDRHPGWDGTAGGRALPASDYWYRLQLAEGRVIQGHFALRR